MTEKDMILMSKREARRLHVVQQVIEKKMTQRKGASVLGLTDRQIRRIIKRVCKEGEDGICHRGRGRPSNRQMPRKIKKKVLVLYRKYYSDFGPTFATEKLLERHDIQLGKGTLRLWLRQEAIPYPTRSARPHHQWRMRKRCRGEMVQMDGSHHDWFEGRGPHCVLMQFIDDATGEVFARFYAYEGTFPAMEGFRGYVERYGMPLSVYCDRHSTYKSNAKATIEEELAGEEPRSQFERALEALGVEVIHAYSPQAKGRVERSFRTLQDRLIKEMRLAGVCTIEEGNRFLEGYLPTYNQRFSSAAADAIDLHRKTPSPTVLDQVLCIQEERTLRNDFTVSYQGRLYQVKDRTRARRVVVEERLDGSIRITAYGRSLRYEAISTLPISKKTPLKLARKGRSPIRPAADHPWRQYPWKQRGKEAVVSTGKKEMAL